MHALFIFRLRLSALNAGLSALALYHSACWYSCWLRVLPSCCCIRPESVMVTSIITASNTSTTTSAIPRFGGEVIMIIAARVTTRCVQSRPIAANAGSCVPPQGSPVLTTSSPASACRRRTANGANRPESTFALSASRCLRHRSTVHGGDQRERIAFLVVGTRQFLRVLKTKRHFFNRTQATRSF